MIWLNGDTCGLKRGLRRCGAVAAGRCVYCNRCFCEQHGIVLADGQEVCSRVNCVAKRDELVLHLAYRQTVAERNDAGACGVEACEVEVVARCVRCQGRFCQRHVARREDVFLENQVRVRREVLLCQHCWERRPIWLRK